MFSNRRRYTESAVFHFGLTVQGSCLIVPIIIRDSHSRFGSRFSFPCRHFGCSGINGLTPHFSFCCRGSSSSSKHNDGKDYHKKYPYKKFDPYYEYYYPAPTGYHNSAPTGYYYSAPTYDPYFYHYKHKSPGKMGGKMGGSWKR